MQNTTREGVVFNQILVLNVTGLNSFPNVHSNILHRIFIYVSNSFFKKDYFLWDYVMCTFFLHIFLILDSGCFVFGNDKVENGSSLYTDAPKIIQTQADRVSFCCITLQNVRSALIFIYIFHFLT